MISETVIDAFRKFVPEENIYLNEPMNLHTTFRVGGAADCLITLENAEQLCRLQKYLNMIELPFVVLGNGSNVVVSDDGYAGIVLQIGEKMGKICVQGERITAQAGASLTKVAREAQAHGLAGMEFASGIPGTVGGGVVMNAGAYGGEMSRVVTQVTVVNQQGELMELDNSTMEFGYRSSIIRNQPFVVTEVTFVLQPGNREEIQQKMSELAAKRREKQPLEYPSAGSTFKRPEGFFAGKLIMDAGLRGFRIGGAQVSEKHCGFVINTGNAAAADVMDVVKAVQQQVKEKFCVDLEPEIIFLGKF